MEIPLLMQLTEKVCLETRGDTGFEIPALSAIFFTILATVLFVAPIPLFSAKWARVLFGLEILPMREFWFELPGIGLTADRF